MNASDSLISSELRGRSLSTLVFLALATLGAVIAVFTMNYGAGVLRILLPAAMVIVGLILYLRSPTSYLAFTFAVWFISPFVRRVIDLYAGWVDPSPVLLAPLLVTLISALSFPSILRLNSKFRWPYLLALAGVLYGLAVSVLRSDAVAAVVPLLDFVAPIMLGAYVLSNWERCQHLAEAFDRIMIAGVLVMGVYGIAQYQFAPVWDTNWMIHVDNGSFGIAEPFGIRVFSTLNSPLPFAYIMMVGLLILANRRSSAVNLISIVGYLAFALSLVRTAWLGWATGAAVLSLSSKRARQRLMLVTLLIALPATALISANPMTQVISKRLQSFAAPNDDASFEVRLTAYKEYVGALLSDPFGQGIASQGYAIDTQVGFGPHDSAVLEIFRCLGWFGGGAYLVALIGLIYRAAFESKGGGPALQSYHAIVWGLVPAALFGSLFSSVSGAISWTVLSLVLADHLRRPQGQCRQARV